MDELAEGAFRPILKLLLMILRGLSFVAWELLVEYVGWSIGWAFYRVVTFGKFPSSGWRELENASTPLALFVEFTGLGLLAGSIYLLSGLIV